MGASPVKTLVAVTIVLSFQALLVGGNLSEVNVFGDFFTADSDEVELTDCRQAIVGGPLIWIGCVGGNLATIALDLTGTIDLAKRAVNAFGIFLGLMTFNIPDAPFWIRLPVSMAVVGSTTWALITVLRGGAN